MADVLTKEQRKKNMQRIKSKDTKIEIILRKALWSHGIRYRKNYSKIPGKPDIAITKYKIAIFCDSEFFHGKNWEIQKVRLAKGDNGEFWINKISKTLHMMMRLIKNSGLWDGLYYDFGEKKSRKIRMNVLKLLKRRYLKKN